MPEPDNPFNDLNAINEKENSEDDDGSMFRLNENVTTKIVDKTTTTTTPVQITTSSKRKRFSSLSRKLSVEVRDDINADVIHEEEEDQIESNCDNATIPATSSTENLSSPVGGSPKLSVGMLPPSYARTKRRSFGSRRSVSTDGWDVSDLRFVANIFFCFLLSCCVE